MICVLEPLDKIRENCQKYWKSQGKMGTLELPYEFKETNAIYRDDSDLLKEIEGSIYSIFSGHMSNGKSIYL